MWLVGKNVSWKQDVLKVELIKLVADLKKIYEAYLFDEIAAQHGRTILQLPP